MAKTQGKIIPNGVSLQKHENDTVVFFTERGFDIELIPISHVSGQRTPDFIMDGLEWETKSPISNKHRTLERALISASGQSSNIIFDLRRLKHFTGQELKVLQRSFYKLPNAKRLKIITKPGRVVDFIK